MLPHEKATSAYRRDVMEDNWKRGEYWSVWGHEDSPDLCSRHFKLERAIEAADRCERQGGAKHRIYYVEELR